MFQKLINKIQKRRAIHRHQVELHATAQRLFPSVTVSAGPFVGMRYAGWSGHGSAVYSKLLGTYEIELHPFVEKIIAAAPTLVVDVGSAEGYYAVGLARRLEKSKVVAADSSPRARAMCSEMARLNHVLDNVEIMGILDKQVLLKYGEDAGGCLICDCEGGEADLLDEEVLLKLSSWFLLVELHEFLVPGIENRLISMAARTHTVEIIDSVDDYRRPYKWPMDCTKGLPVEIEHDLYSEGRPGLMRWLCAAPKAPAS